MTHIDSRHVRILVGEDIGESRSQVRRSEGSYGLLVQRRRLRNQTRHGAIATKEETETPEYSTQIQMWQDDPPRDVGAAISEEHASPSSDSLPSHICEIVHNILTRANGHARRIAELAQTIARFCADSSVSGNGQWELEIELDERVLPHTTLRIHVSPFAVHIRFYAKHPSSKGLVFEYRHSLKNRLEKAMVQYGRPCDVEIEIV